MKKLKKFAVYGRNVMWMPPGSTSWYVSPHKEYNRMVLKEHLAHHKARFAGAYGAEQLELDLGGDEDEAS